MNALFFYSAATLTCGLQAAWQMRSTSHGFSSVRARSVSLPIEMVSARLVCEACVICLISTETVSARIVTPIATNRARITPDNRTIHAAPPYKQNGSETLRQDGGANNDVRENLYQLPTYQ